MLQGILYSVRTWSLSSRYRTDAIELLERDVQDGDGKQWRRDSCQLIERAAAGNRKLADSLLVQAEKWEEAAEEERERLMR